MNRRRGRYGRTTVAVAALLLSGCWAVLGPGAGSASAVATWTSSFPGPYEVAESYLNGVSCTSSTACTAVGALSPYSGGGHFETPLVQRWNGTGWTQQTTPALSYSGELDSVSCKGSTFCMAVGFDADTDFVPVRAVAEVWNGATWTGVSPDSSARLSSVSCTSSTACTAVGNFDAGGVAAFRWNGTTWATQSVVTSSSYFLQGVSCVGSSLCVAVGRPGLIERWNGTSWHVVSQPKGGSAYLTGVSCTATTSCVAVGSKPGSTSSARLTLVEHWNGTAWTAKASPNPAGSTQAALESVSCTSDTACDAVGTNEGTNFLDPHKTIAEHWNGTSWTLKTTPNHPHVKINELHAVSCTNECVAVGQWANDSVKPRVFAERETAGTWALPAAAPPRRKVPSLLGSVSCTSSAFCVAIGNDRIECGIAGCGSTPLIERWTGARWIAVEPKFAWLEGVSCSSSSACTAVGFTYDSGKHERLAVRRWNGTSWVTQSISSAYEGELAAVSCTSSTSCTAVGFFLGSDAKARPLVMRWNGSSWARVSAPYPNPRSYLNSVSCTSTTACTAVGSYSGAGGAVNAFVERWNGTVWVQQATPLPADDSALYSVSCTSSTACTAVGSHLSHSLPLAMSWNGTSWVIRTTPTLAGNNELRGVSCTSSTACVAVGTAASSPLTERWNGSTWTIEPAGPADAALYAVSCVSGSVCTAVGSSAGPGGDFGLVNRD
ncbi:MAG: hypothetical protein QOH89_884 [Pseudonocardiales bacterium]|nr:hypothetical protein [Pseudonocardiales bacterium]